MVRDGRHGERQPGDQENVRRGRGKHLAEDQDYASTSQKNVLGCLPYQLPPTLRDPRHPPPAFRPYRSMCAMIVQPPVR